MILRKLQKLINNPPEENERPNIGQDDTDYEDFEDDGLDYEDQYYTGIPAPPILEYDPWFGPPPPLTEKQEEIRAQLEEEKQLIAAEEDKSPSKEVANIHEVMYNVATNNGKTTVQLDPPGGSEKFQSGPGGWKSGNGFNQF